MRTVEKTSAAEYSITLESGVQSHLVQRKKATFRTRSPALMKADKTHDTLKHSNVAEVGDGNHGSGRTQELQEMLGFHSTSKGDTHTT